MRDIKFTKKTNHKIYSLGDGCRHIIEQAYAIASARRLGADKKREVTAKIEIRRDFLWLNFLGEVPEVTPASGKWRPNWPRPDDVATHIRAIIYFTTTGPWHHRGKLYQKCKPDTLMWIADQSFACSFFPAEVMKSMDNCVTNLVKNIKSTSLYTIMSAMSKGYKGG